MQAGYSMADVGEQLFVACEDRYRPKMQDMEPCVKDTGDQLIALTQSPISDRTNDLT